MRKTKEVKAQYNQQWISFLASRKMYFLIFAFCFVLYGNTIINEYSFDDEYVTYHNTQVEQGIRAIPAIFTSYYTEGSNTKGLYGYRPMVKTSFAIERSLFGESPHMSHFINILLYGCVGALIFYLLKKWFRNYHILFPALVVLIFLAHPVHTEVVASLKNRDVLFSFLGGMLSLLFVMKYLDENKAVNLLYAFLTCLFAFFSKPDTQPFLILIPVVAYYFSNAPFKKSIWGMVWLSIGLTTVFFLVNLKLPVMGRAGADISFYENPLYFQKDFLIRLGTSFNALFFYLRILAVPTPLLFYYGYNTIAVESLTGIVPLLSLLIYLALAIFALMNLKGKNIIAFGIMWYLLHISIVSNLFVPIVGIVAERYVFAASLGFCIVLAYFILKFSKMSVEASSSRLVWKPVFVVASTLLLLLFAEQTISRNKDWKNSTTLFNHDLPLLHNSVKAQEMAGAELVRQAGTQNEEQKRKELIGQAITRYQRAVEIYPEYVTGNNNIGTFYSTVFNDCESAIPYFKKALATDSGSGEAMINLGLCYAKQGKNEDAIPLLEKGIERLPGKFLVSYMTLLALYFEKSEMEKVLRVFEQTKVLYPNSEVPYKEMAMQYLAKKDTLHAVDYFEASLKVKADKRLSGLVRSYRLRTR